jgi:spectinomycin phosphotransferase
MLEKPDLQDEKIIACLQDEYGLNVVQVAFLPLGADRNTAVYHVVAEDETPYFLKLRGGVFDELAVALPKFLSDQGIVQIIAPLATRTGQLWANLDAFKTILYPFVEGHNGYEVNLSDRQWSELGTALKRIHTAVVPPALIRRIQRETYSPQWREIVKTFLEHVEDDAFDDPVAIKLVAFLKARRDEILDLVGRAERLAQALQARSPEFVLCHSDIHAGNILIDANDAFYIVDWDDPILAPKERDLMFVGGGLLGAGHSPQEEEALFYRGYGQTQIDPIALAYYRYERIIQDIAVFCEQIFLTNEGGKDREQSLSYLMSNFLPNNTIEIAYKSDKTLRAGYGASGAVRP